MLRWGNDPRFLPVLLPHEEHQLDSLRRQVVVLQEALQNHLNVDLLQYPQPHLVCVVRRVAEHEIEREVHVSRGQLARLGDEDTELLHVVPHRRIEERGVQFGCIDLRQLQRGTAAER